jgi:hypothetical protein
VDPCPAHQPSSILSGAAAYVTGVDLIVDGGVVATVAR